MADGLQKAMEVFTKYPGNRNTPLDVVVLLSYSTPTINVENTLKVADTLKRVN